MMSDVQYDFAGWATVNDLKCSDGLIIRHGAFAHNHGKEVPLVWQHNSHDIKHILGRVQLEHSDKGVYAYGSFNSGTEASVAKELLKHGDLKHLSIGANRIKRDGSNVIHGDIYEVSLVLAGANPGAVIESVLTHSDETDETVIIYTEEIIHTEKEILTHEDKKEDESDDKTIGDILDSLNDEQMDAVTSLLGAAIINAGGKEMKHNVFSGSEDKTNEDVLQHSDVLQSARDCGTLKGSYLEHGITNVEVLFPDAKLLNNQPVVYDNNLLAVDSIVGAASKSPFSRIKTSWADLTPETARARGYIRGSEKLEQVWGVLTRETTPQTVYVKQSLERDDILDITDFDVVAFANAQLRTKLMEELAMAVLVGDGRPAMDADKIKPDHIRPVISDDDVYTIKNTYTDVNNLFEVIIKTMVDYRGSGTPTMFVHPNLLADIKLLRVSDTDRRFLFGDIPTDAAVAARFGVAKVVPCSFLAEDGIVLVNMRDYTMGSTKGGQITSFDDFDIDFNKYKYLIETRLCGALTQPKSAVYLTKAPETPATRFAAKKEDE